MVFNFEFDIGTDVKFIGKDNTWYPVKSVSSDRSSLKVKGLYGKFIKTHIIEFSNDICAKSENSGEVYRLDGFKLNKQIDGKFETVYVNPRDFSMNKDEMIRAYKFLVN